jgi:hypothetical protein
MDLRSFMEQSLNFLIRSFTTKTWSTITGWRLSSRGSVAVRSSWLRLALGERACAMVLSRRVSDTWLE